MTFTPEQLRSFAEAGGWSVVWKLDHYALTKPNGEIVQGFADEGTSADIKRRIEIALLPDFPNDLAACFEVLEHVSQVYQLNKVHPDDVAQYGQYELAIYTPFSPTRNGDTKQAAIIAAVLAAKEANDRH